MKKVLTIAGSDSSGGAGIQADLKAFFARGVFGMSAITALTAQNTVGVQGVFEVDLDFIAKQIDSVMQDIGTDAWKTGMLSNESTINLVAEKVNEYGIDKIVVDPVMAAKGGDSLLQESAEKTLISKLLPVASLITPNHYEAQIISNKEINSVDDMKVAARKIVDLGIKSVLIKGGNLSNQEMATDILFDGNEITEFVVNRIDTKNTHGSGCTYASAIAAELAKKKDLKDAICIAKAYVHRTIEESSNLKIGNGRGPVIHNLNQEFKVKPSIIKIKQVKPD